MNLETPEQFRISCPICGLFDYDHDVETVKPSYDMPETLADHTSDPVAPNGGTDTFRRSRHAESCAIKSRGVIQDREQVIRRAPAFPED